MGNDSSTSKRKVEHTIARAYVTNEARWNTSVVAEGECGSVETYLEKCFDREGSFDPNAILQVPQRRHRADLDSKPTAEEIEAAIKKMKR